MATEKDLPVIGGQQPGDAPKQRCLSSTACAEDGDHLAGLKLEGNIFQDDMIAETLP